MSETINKLYEKKDILIEIYQNIKHFVVEKRNNEIVKKVI